MTMRAGNWGGKLGADSEADATNKIFRFMNLPREIRDQIYTYLLAQTYIIVPERYNGFVERVFYSPEHLPSLAILRVSKTVYTEAVSWIYLAGHFEYCIFPGDKDRSTILPQDTRGFHMVQNINLTVDVTEYFFSYGNFDIYYARLFLNDEPFYKQFDEFVRLFGGNRIRRKSLRVTFKLGHGSPDLHLVVSYPVVRFLTKMTGFKHVIVDAEALLPRRDDCPFRGVIYKYTLQSMTDRFQCLDAFIDAMKTGFMRRLGPAHDREGDLERYDELAGMPLIELTKKGDHKHCDRRYAKCLDYYERSIEFYPMLPKPSKKAARKRYHDSTFLEHSNPEGKCQQGT